MVTPTKKKTALLKLSPSSRSGGRGAMCLSVTNAWNEDYIQSLEDNDCTYAIFNNTTIYCNEEDGTNFSEVSSVGVGVVYDDDSSFGSRHTFSSSDSADVEEDLNDGYEDEEYLLDKEGDDGDGEDKEENSDENSDENLDGEDVDGQVVEDGPTVLPPPGLVANDDLGKLPAEVFVNEDVVLPPAEFDESKNLRQCQMEENDMGHVLVPFHELREFIYNNLTCNCGNYCIGGDYNKKPNEGPHLARQTIGIATRLIYTCGCCGVVRTVEPTLREGVLGEGEPDMPRFAGLWAYNKDRDLSTYAQNVKLVLLTQLIGASKKAASLIAGMLDMNESFPKIGWRRLEDMFGVGHIELSKEILVENKEKEVSGEEPGLDGRYVVRAGADMGWQKRSRTYDSNSGHCFLVGKRSGKILEYQNYAKTCSLCSYWERRNLLARPHPCGKNYYGSSKGMESKGILECVSRMWFESNLTVTHMCMDRDATTRALLHPLGLSPKGLLPVDHPKIVIYTDPNHNVRCFGKGVFSLARKALGESKMNRVDAHRLKRNFGYWMHKGDKSTFENFKWASHAVVEHHFNNHTYCDISFCHHKGKDDGELASLTKYRDKTEYPKLYKQCLEILEKNTTDDILEGMMHDMTTQKNESLNRVVMKYAPKEVCYSKSMSLSYRICIAVGIDSIGYLAYLDRVFRKWGIKMTTTTRNLVALHDVEYDMQRIRKSDNNYRRAVAYRKQQAWRDECMRQIEDQKKNHYYGTPLVVEDNGGEKRKFISPNTTKTCKCGKTDHQRTTHKSCVLNKQNIIEAATLAAATRETDGDKAGK
jgi:hypothetical protein